MKKLLLATMVFASSQVYAMTQKADFGLRLNHANADGFSSNDQLKFQGGVILGMPLNQQVGFRTGALLAIKDTEIQTSGIKFTVNRLYIDVPATISFGNGDFQGYAGFNLGLKVSSSCSVSGGTCSMIDEKSLVLQPVIGADFAVATSTQAGFFYELETEYSRSYKQSAIGAKASFAF